MHNKASHPARLETLEGNHTTDVTDSLRVISPLVDEAGPILAINERDRPR